MSPAQIDSEKLLGAVLWTDFLAFSEKCFYTLNPGKAFLANWHHEAIAHQLIGTTGTLPPKRLLINLPPRHMKSELVSVFFSAWLLAQDPATTIIAVSYGNDLARKLSRAVRKIMSADWYRNLFPKTVLSRDKCTETELETTAGGRRFTTTVSAEIVGHGADYIIVDDPHPVGRALTGNLEHRAAEWYSDELVTRLTPGGAGVIIVVMQRAKPNDLSGYLLQTGQFKQLKLPLLATQYERIQIGDHLFHERWAGDFLHPQWFGPEQFEQRKNEISPAGLEAQYQQDPKPGGGALLKLGYFAQFPKLLRRSAYEAVVQCWDCASSISEFASYSVCITFGLRNGVLYVLDVWRSRVEYPALLKAALRLVDRFGPSHILIEKASVGASLLPDLREKLGGRGIYSDAPKDTKIERAERHMHLFIRGKIGLPLAAPFLATLCDEISSFPNSYYDDQIDCLVLALIALQRGILRSRSIEYNGSKPRLDGYTNQSVVTTQSACARPFNPKIGPWSAAAVRNDLRAKMAAIEAEPSWMAEPSERDREYARESKSARTALLKRLDCVDAVLTVARFRSALEEAHATAAAPESAIEPRYYIEALQSYALHLADAYCCAEW